MKRSTAAAALLIALLSGAAAAASADVEMNSMRVMPFSMDATKHIFTPSAGGGTQSVVVINGERHQLPLVRTHLKKEAAAFARGNFRDPAAIHGPAMPGLKTLKAHSDRLTVIYRDIPRGGEIVFRSRDPAVIRALHDWFAAQVHDHGAHAMTM